MVNSFHIRRPNEAVLTYLIFYCPKLNNLSAGVFRGFDGIYIVDIDESMDYQQKKAQIKANNPSITYDYLDLGFNLIDYLERLSGIKGASIGVYYYKPEGSQAPLEHTFLIYDKDSQTLFYHLSLM